MLKKLKVIWAPAFFSIFVFLQTTPIFAITNQLGKYNITSYQSIVKADGGWFGWVDDSITNMMNSIANFLFGTNKLIWQGLDTVIKYCYKADIFNDYADMIGSVAKQMYRNLYSSVGFLFFGIVVISCGIIFIRSSPEKAFKQLLTTILVLILSGVWFNQSGYFMKVLNGATNELQADISSAGTISGDKLVNNGEKDSLSSASENLRSNYFLMSVEEPFYLMNYGTTVNDQVKAKTNDGKSIDEYLIEKEVSKEGVDKVKNNLDKVDYDTNEYLSPDELPYKMTISFFAILETSFFGIIQVIIAILSIVIQFLAVLIDLILPVFAILSIFPRFNNLFYGGIKGMAMVLLAKASLGIVMLSFRLVLLFVDNLIPRGTMAGFTGNIFFKIFMLIVIYLFRRPLGNLMKTMIGNGLNKFKAEAIPEPVNNVLPKNSFFDREPVGQLDSNLMNSLNRGIAELTNAIQGNPDSEAEVKNEEADFDKSDEPIGESDEEISESNLEDDLENINSDVDLDLPENVKKEMLEEENVSDIKEKDVVNFDEYQNLTASNYEGIGLDSLENSLPPESLDTSSFEERLAELESE